MTLSATIYPLMIFNIHWNNFQISFELFFFSRLPRYECIFTFNPQTPLPNLSTLLQNTVSIDLLNVHFRKSDQVFAKVYLISLNGSKTLSQQF